MKKLCLTFQPLVCGMMVKFRSNEREVFLLFGQHCLLKSQINISEATALHEHFLTADDDNANYVSHISDENLLVIVFPKCLPQFFF